MTRGPVELLAPAGDPEKLRMAIQYGADAVYLAAHDFSLRAYSGNFSLPELSEAICYAHEHQANVYLALNILAHQSDMANLRSRLPDLLETGPDGVIVADPAVFCLVRELAPDIRIHISTQASVTNADTCRFWHELGASRVVLARELSLAEIREIRKETPPGLELEAFVHGAMCMAYSGRCLLSMFYSGRDSNRGRCSQPCRWKYKVAEEKRPDIPLDITGDSRGSYFFNSRDLCMIDHIPDLIGAGLSSLKIEGRVKSAFYVATVVKAYREALDSYFTDPDSYRVNPAWQSDLSKTVHREFDTGFYYTSPIDDPKIAPDEMNVREAAVVGIVRAYLPDSRMVLVEQRNKVANGEILELVSPNGRHMDVIAIGMTDLERQPIQSTPHPQMFYYLPVPSGVPTGSFLRRLGDKDRQKIRG